jgi:hypothetical protein
MPSKNKIIRERAPKSITKPKKKKKPKQDLNHLIKSIKTISFEHEKEMLKRQKLEHLLKMREKDIEDVHKINGEIRKDIKEAYWLLRDMALSDTALFKAMQILEKHLPMILNKENSDEKKI